MSVFLLSILSILPTITYVISIYYLGDVVGNLDLPSILGSYLGLLLLSNIFCAISVFASSLSSNQIISFIIGIILCLLFYYGFDFLSELSIFQSFDLMIQKFGIAYHYNDMSKGLLKLSDVIYFLSITFLFLKMSEKLVYNRIR